MAWSTGRNPPIRILDMIELTMGLTHCRLMREATIRSRKSGEKDFSANTVRKVTEVRCLSPI